MLEADHRLSWVHNNADRYWKGHRPIRSCAARCADELSELGVGRGDDLTAAAARNVLEVAALCERRCLGAPSPSPTHPHRQHHAKQQS